jgi:Zn finger protein HypA/HybF involved in hydrogenase expression
MQKGWLIISVQNKEIGGNMCSVGDSFGIEIEGGMEPHEYVCNHCGKEFKGIGAGQRCPKCHSTDVKCIE